MSASHPTVEPGRLPLWLAKPKGKSARAPLKPTRPPHSFGADFLRSLGEEIVSFAQWIQPTDQETEARQELATLVEEVVQQMWPSAQVKVFGSSSTGLALPVSDVDFVVHGLDDHLDGSFHLFELSEALQGRGMADVRVIASAKVPLIKFVEPASRLCGDISFGVRNAMESVGLVKTYLGEFAAAKPLILVLKTLLHQNSLNVVHTGGLSSYAITLLVVSYLRVLQSTATDREKEALEELDGFAMGNAIVGFMKYFASTDLRNHVFTPANKENPVSVTKPYQPYPTSRFVLEDPLDSSNDITRGTYLVAQVQLLLWYSLQALAQYPVYGHTLPSPLSAVINPRDFTFLSRFTDFENAARKDDRGD